MNFSPSETPKLCLKKFPSTIFLAHGAIFFECCARRLLGHTRNACKMGFYGTAAPEVHYRGRSLQNLKRQRETKITQLVEVQDPPKPHLDRVLAQKRLGRCDAERHRHFSVLKIKSDGSLEVKNGHKASQVHFYIKSAQPRIRSTDRLAINTETKLCVNLLLRWFYRCPPLHQYSLNSSPEEFQNFPRRRLSVKWLWSRPGCMFGEINCPNNNLRILTKHLRKYCGSELCNGQPLRNLLLASNLQNSASLCRRHLHCTMQFVISSGPRECPAKYLSNVTLFTVFANIMQHLEVHQVPRDPHPPFDEFQPGFSNKPLPYEVRFISRF